MCSVLTGSFDKGAISIIIAPGKDKGRLVEWRKGGWVRTMGMGITPYLHKVC